MIGKLSVFNVLTGKKERFNPLHPPFVGMYVCGPTVYSHVHLGNLRTFLSFDIIYRYLKFIGYQVRYVRNITDVGHLMVSGEDKIAKKAKLENLEPMEVVQQYQNDFRNVMNLFNALPPNIEPSAIGHLQEQIDVIKQLVEKKLAYLSNGSVYFDVSAYNKVNQYGILSRRNIDELITETRNLEGGKDKKSPLDFALWKKANEEHIMRWNTEWSSGFPGWHLECSVMSTKYLGNIFDIHGGGMDLKFPHHECEIAQNTAVNGSKGAKYWIHTNMLTVNGQKMSKSLDNSFLPHQLVSGNHKLLEKGFSPMTIRFFMLQSHYSSTLDFSNEALKSAEKGYLKLINALKVLKEMESNQYKEEATNTKLVEQVNTLCDNCYHTMNDDFNTARTIGNLFGLVKIINSLHTSQIHPDEIGKTIFLRMKQIFIQFMEDILGLKQENRINLEVLLQTVIEEYKLAKYNRDFEKVDRLRIQLHNAGVKVKDMKDTIDWAYEE